MNEKRVIEFIVFAIADFARAKQISFKEAFLYLHQYKGISFLEEIYEVEHTLPPADTIETLTTICRRNGGDL
jgi:hypothetical protein